MLKKARVFEDEHQARLKDPGQFIRIRREGPEDHEFGPGVHIYWGIKPKKKEGPEGGRTDIQSIHFDKDKFSVGEAKAWLKEHDFKPIEFVPAGKEASVKETVRPGWVELECPACGEIEEYRRSKMEGEAPTCYACGETLDITSFEREGSMKKKADILYPNLVAPEDFQTGDVVRKIFGDFRVTEYLGIVLAIHPTTNTVDVRWPYGIGFENPQDLVRVNPWFEPPSVVINSEGYYTTWDAERWNTPNPEDNPTKGVSGKSPIYVDSGDGRAPEDGGNFTASTNPFYVIPVDSITITAGTATIGGNVIKADLDFEELRKQAAPIRIAQRFLKRAFNNILRIASVPYNERLSEIETYKFLYKRLGKIYSEPTIRSVVSYLYCKPHNYYEEDFDQILKRAVRSALNEDKKELKKVFQEIIELTEGKKGTKINDLLDAAVKDPFAKAIYKNIKEAVKRSKGNLDILPTPAARFANQRSKEAEELERIAAGIERSFTAQEEGVIEYLVDFGSQEKRGEFAEDAEFAKFADNFTTKFRGASSLAFYGVSADLEDQIDALVDKHAGTIEWKHGAVVPEEAV